MSDLNMMKRAFVGSGTRLLVHDQRPPEEFDDGPRPTPQRDHVPGLKSAGVVAFDVSPSVRPDFSRIIADGARAVELKQKVDPAGSLAIHSFSDDAVEHIGLTPATQVDVIKAALVQMKVTGGSTNITAAIKRAYATLAPVKQVPRWFLGLTDGANNVTDTETMLAAADMMKDAEIKLFVIGYGTTPEPLCQELASPGCFYTAADVDKLWAVLETVVRKSSLAR